MRCLGSSPQATARPVAQGINPGCPSKKAYLAEEAAKSWWHGLPTSGGPHRSCGGGGDLPVASKSMHRLLVRGEAGWISTGTARADCSPPLSQSGSARPPAPPPISVGTHDTFPGGGGCWQEFSTTRTPVLQLSVSCCPRDRYLGKPCLKVPPGSQGSPTPRLEGLGLAAISWSLPASASKPRPRRP